MPACGGCNSCIHGLNQVENIRQQGRLFRSSSSSRGPGTSSRTTRRQPLGADKANGEPTACMNQPNQPGLPSIQNGPARGPRKLARSARRPLSRRYATPTLSCSRNIEHTKPARRGNAAVAKITAMEEVRKRSKTRRWVALEWKSR